MLSTARMTRGGATTENIVRDMSPAQLAGIGLVTLAWNEIEFALDVALYSGEALPADCLTDDLPRRRLDKKIDQVQKAVERWQLPTACVASIERAAKALFELKDLRNAVIHSRLFDMNSGIGTRITLKGEVEWILLTAEALNWLYQQLVFARHEMRAVVALFDLVRTTEIAERSGLVPLGKIGSIPELEHWNSEAERYCGLRLALGRAPAFPQ